jgi:uncharacterized membrane protein YbhN (UPF0104 family)
MRFFKNNCIKKIIPIAFYILLVIFLFFYLKSIDFSKIITINIAWQYILLATIFGLFFRYFGAYIWTVILRTLGAENVHYSKDLIHVYSKAWMGRYIPGTAPWILGKIFFASQHGISKNKLAIGSLLEAALQIIVQLVFSLLILAFDVRLKVIPNYIKIVILFIAIICVLALVPNVFNKLMGVVYKIILKKKLDKEHHATNQTIFRGFTLYVVGSIVSSLSLFFIAKAIYPSLSYSNMLFVMGADTLAGAIGMIVIFAPSGIGVREGIQLTLLSLIMPKELALIITVVTRLWNVLVDLLFFALGALFDKKLKISQELPSSH